jgi:aldose 1-epimerase
VTERDLSLVRVAGGPYEVEILPAVGARIHRIRAFGEDILRTPPQLAWHVDDPYVWGSYPMAPWCNRIAAGPSRAAGRAVDLPASFPDGTAIHGQVSRRPWDILGDARFAIDAGGDGWPWRYRVEQTVAVEDEGLRLDLGLTNRSDSPMPAGLGIHPWFRRPVLVAIAAAAVHPSNASTEPEPRALTDDDPLNVQELTALAEGTDATWVALGRPPVRLAWPELGLAATMTVAAPSLCVTAACLPGTDGVAVEPATHAPDGLRRLERGEPDGLTRLEPGATMTMTVRLDVRRSRAAEGEQT